MYGVVSVAQVLAWGVFNKNLHVFDLYFWKYLLMLQLSTLWKAGDSPLEFSVSINSLTCRSPVKLGLLHLPQPQPLKLHGSNSSQQQITCLLLVVANSENYINYYYLTLQKTKKVRNDLFRKVVVQPQPECSAVCKCYRCFHLKSSPLNDKEVLVISVTT